MIKVFVDKVKPKMKEVTDYFNDRLRTVRTGGAQTSLVEEVLVSYYGDQQPLKSLAQISTPESNIILIQPFDHNAFNDIRLAIINANLGLNPSDDGRQLRIVVPPLTEERRLELVKLAKSYAEESRINLRTIREEAWREAQKFHKEKKLSDDDRTWVKEELDKIINEYNQIVENFLKEKETALKKI